MKARDLAIAAGLGAPLIVCNTGAGEFVGLDTAFNPNEFGITTLNAYAVFDRPGEDHMLAAAGSPGNPLST